MSVGYFYILLGLGVLVLLAFLSSLIRGLGRRHRFPYVIGPSLFSPAEQTFLPVLERAVGQGYRIYGKVRVADALQVRPRTGRRARRRAAERLSGRRFDFLVCTAETGTIACAVNLSPRSRFSRRPSRDTLDRICAAARLPFVRFREGDRYSVVEIEEQVFGAMQAVRLSAKEAEPPREETEEALGGLSATISSEKDEGQAGAKVRPWARPAPGRGKRTEPVAKPDAGVSAARADRTEPVLAPVVATDAEVDEGPQFRIEGDLELDERPMRLGKT